MCKTATQYKCILEYIKYTCIYIKAPTKDGDKKGEAGGLNKAKYPGICETLERSDAQIDCTLIVRSSVVWPRMTGGNTPKEQKTASDNNRHNNSNNSNKKDKNAAFGRMPTRVRYYFSDGITLYNA